MRLALWFKAFIPREIYLDQVKVTKTIAPFAILGSSDPVTVLPFLTSLPQLSAAYETDQRSFAAAPEALARITTTIIIDDLKTPGSISITRYSDPTRRYSSPAFSFFQVPETKISTPAGEQQITLEDNKLTLDFSTWGSNPFFMFYGISYAPAIQMKLHCGIDMNEDGEILRLRISGDFTAFPAFEAYLSIDNGPAIQLFQLDPSSNSTPFNLYSGLTQTIDIEYEDIINGQRKLQFG